jgi:short-subunit dehydrogenase involved in D-alanine esterification of teichoic acids
VDTDLDRGARGRRNQDYQGIPASEVAESALAGFANDEYEITIGQAQGLREGTRQESEQIFQRMNGHW